MSYPPYWAYAASYPYSQSHPYFFYPYPCLHSAIREYPPVETGTLRQSIQDYYKLMEEGYRILNKLSEQSFAYRIMAAAQAGNKQEVDRLMKTISTTASIQSEFSPSGIGITVNPISHNHSCCKLVMFLRWGS